MRTVVDIKEDVLRRAMKLSGISKKVEIVNYALARLVSQMELEQILELAGRIEWDGDLDEMRRDRDGSR